MLRTDLTSYLVHWTKGSFDEAFNALASIAINEAIIGGSCGVRANCNCVCFTEAPIKSFHEVKGLFKPFGIMVSKRWLFGLGGRPVIYQPQEDFELLSDEIKWKHVDFSMMGVDCRNYTWQREWRIRTDVLSLPASEVTLILPDDFYRGILQTKFSDENYARGIASCDPYGYGAELVPSQASEYKIQIIPS